MIIIILIIIIINFYNNIIIIIIINIFIIISNFDNINIKKKYEEKNVYMSILVTPTSDV